MVKACFSYLFCQSRNCGITFLQLIQPQVQNSTRTTRPFKSDNVSGWLLIQGPPDISGATLPVVKASPRGGDKSHVVSVRKSASSTIAARTMLFSGSFNAGSRSNKFCGFAQQLDAELADLVSN